MSDVPRKILIVDDDEGRLTAIADATAVGVADRGGKFVVATWQPRDDQKSAFDEFGSRVDSDTVLVASDVELTSAGQTGLFGPTIVAWCQKRIIPVCGYSQQEKAQTKEPNLFEFRLPVDPRLAGLKIAALAKGFDAIGQAFGDDQRRLLADHSPTTALAHLLEHPNATAPFNLYAARLASSNSALIDMIVGQAPNPSKSTRAALATYVAGHLLANAILAFPGPISSSRVLCAYVALPDEAEDDLIAFFERARYRGPFEELECFFWIDAVDEVLEAAADKVGVSYDEPVDVWRRNVIETTLQRVYGRHTCERCQGHRGGFWCPFERRPVCERKDCSVGSSSLIPRGAGLTRVERGFFDEWAPLLGL